MTVKLCNDYWVVIAKYRFIEMIVLPRITYFFPFLIRWHTTTYITGLFFTLYYQTNSIFGFFLSFYYYFLFLSFTWFFFRFGSSSKYHRYIATMMKLERYYYCYYIVLDIYLRPDFTFTSLSLFLSLYLHALSKEKHLVHVALLWIFALPADHVR